MVQGVVLGLLHLAVERDLFDALGDVLVARCDVEHVGLVGARLCQRCEAGLQGGEQPRRSCRRHCRSRLLMQDKLLGDAGWDLDRLTRVELHVLNIYSSYAPL